MTVPLRAAFLVKESAWPLPDDGLANELHGRQSQTSHMRRTIGPRQMERGALRQTRRQCFLASLLMRVSLGQAGYARDGYIGYAVLFPSGRPSGASMKLWRGTRLIGIHGNEMEPCGATWTRETGFWKTFLTCGAGVAV